LTGDENHDGKNIYDKVGYDDVTKDQNATRKRRK
jgi:hypothetical protein